MEWRVGWVSLDWVLCIDLMVQRDRERELFLRLSLFAGDLSLDLGLQFTFGPCVAWEDMPRVRGRNERARGGKCESRGFLCLIGRNK